MASPKKYPVKQKAKNWTACELSVQYKSGFKCENPITNSLVAYNLIRSVWDKEKINIQEQMMAFFINPHGQTIGYRVISMGTMNSCPGNPKLIASFALHTLADCVIIAHNHPAGSLKPSQADLTLTKELKDALNLIEVKLLDHLIITGKSYLSMADEGFI
jgi:DNA repair protein RadC